MGSVAERVARHAPCPVLLTRGDGAPFQRVVLGVNRSEGAARAAAWLREFPLPAGCEVRFVTLLPNLREIAHEHVMLQPPLTEHPMPLDQWQREQASTHLAEVAASFQETGKQTATEIRSGDAAPGLIDVATDEGADLVVLGSHGGGALERFFLGSVSQQVLTHAPCSVLVVRGAAGS
jgi:nucleotide-binding universal stress UspA family protein